MWNPSNSVKLNDAQWRFRSWDKEVFDDVSEADGLEDVLKRLIVVQTPRVIKWIRNSINATLFLRRIQMFRPFLLKTLRKYRTGHMTSQCRKISFFVSQLSVWKQKINELKKRNILPRIFHQLHKTHGDRKHICVLKSNTRPIYSNVVKNTWTQILRGCDEPRLELRLQRKTRLRALRNDTWKPLSSWTGMRHIDWTSVPGGGG